MEESRIVSRRFHHHVARNTCTILFAGIVCPERSLSGIPLCIYRIYRGLRFYDANTCTYKQSECLYGSSAGGGPGKGVGGSDGA